MIANIRGGGEYGPMWHQAALRENRYKAYEDFEAVAQELSVLPMVVLKPEPLALGSKPMVTLKPCIWPVAPAEELSEELNEEVSEAPPKGPVPENLPFQLWPRSKYSSRWKLSAGGAWRSRAWGLRSRRCRRRRPFRRCFFGVPNDAGRVLRPVSSEEPSWMAMWPSGSGDFRPPSNFGSPPH